jgi:ADP-ribose pyrophosphatase
MATRQPKTSRKSSGKTSTDASAARPQPAGEAAPTPTVIGGAAAAAADIPREVLGQGKFLQLVREGRWEIAERVGCRGAVAIVAVSEHRELILTEQYRPAVQARVIDLAAGLVGDEPGHEHEPISESARRELLEETGYAAAQLIPLATCPSSPGLTSEVVSYFLAANARRRTAGGGVAHEAIVVHAIPLRTVRRWLLRQADAGVMIDIKVYAALSWLARLPTALQPSAASRSKTASTGLSKRVRNSSKKSSAQ